MRLYPDPWKEPAQRGASGTLWEETSPWGQWPVGSSSFLYQMLLSISNIPPTTTLEVGFLLLIIKAHILVHFTIFQAVLVLEMYIFKFNPQATP